MYQPPNENWPTLEQVHSDPYYGPVQNGMLGFITCMARKINSGDSIRSWKYCFIFHIELLRINPYLITMPSIKRTFANFHEVLQKYPSLKEYRECVIRELDPEYYIILRKRTHCKWILLKALVKFLSLQKRAVITANHPERLKKLGVFD